MLNKDYFGLIDLENTEEKMTWLVKEIRNREERIMVACFDKESKSKLL